MTRRVVVALAALALAAPVWFAAPAGAAPAAPCAPGKAGATRVAVVIDNGGSVDARCVEINATMNGAQFLAARAQILGTPAPTYNASGLLCSVDGYPNTGCGDRSGGSFAYWSYWDGRSGSWVYSSVGPASRRMTGSSVEGWRFQRAGSGKPTDPPPRFAAARNRICPPPTPTTAAPAPRATSKPAATRSPAPVATASPRTPTQQPTQAGVAANQPAPQAAPAVNATPNNPAQPAPVNAGSTGATPANGAQPAQPATPVNGQGATIDRATTPPTRSGTPTTKKTKADTSKKASTTTKKPDKKKSTTTTSAKAPKGGPTTLAEGANDLGRVTNVAAAASVVGSDSGESSSGWLGMVVGLLAIGGAVVSARWLRQRRSP